MAISSRGGSPCSLMWFLSRVLIIFIGEKLFDGCGFHWNWHTDVGQNTQVRKHSFQHVSFKKVFQLWLYVYLGLFGYVIEKHIYSEQTGVSSVIFSYCPPPEFVLHCIGFDEKHQYLVCSVLGSKILNAGTLSCEENLLEMLAERVQVNGFPISSLGRTSCHPW